MRKIEEQELLGYIQGNPEGRKLEFKPCLIWDDIDSRKLKEEITKAVMVMANTPGGGTIILGITQQRGKKQTLLFEGATDKQISYFESNYETVEKHIEDFCSDHPELEIVWGETNKIEEGKTSKFILLLVNEFRLLPIICQKTGKSKEENGRDHVLREGDIYSRSARPTWSSKRCTSKELEEIIKLAADKHRQELRTRGYVKLEDLVVKLKEERADYE